jgi:hypothetical protein
MVYEVLIVTENGNTIYGVTDEDLLQMIKTAECQYFECIRLSTRQTLAIKDGKVFWSDIPYQPYDYFKEAT